MAQRLLRLNCPRCAEPDHPSGFFLEPLGLQDEDWPNLRRGRGCAACDLDGTRGRLALFEFLEVTGVVRDWILLGSERDLLEAGRASGLVSLVDQAVARALAGEISVEEAYRTCCFGGEP